MNARKPQKQPLMGLGVPHPIPGLSYPSLIVPSESQGEIEALTEGVGGGGATTTQNDYNLFSDYLKPAKDPKYTDCSFKAWEATLAPGMLNEYPTGILQAPREGTSQEPG